MEVEQVFLNNVGIIFLFRDSSRIKFHIKNREKMSLFPLNNNNPIPISKGAVEKLSNEFSNRTVIVLINSPTLLHYYIKASAYFNPIYIFKITSI